MARTAKPWYYQQKQAYYAVVNGRKIRLLKAEESPANEKKAASKLKELKKKPTTPRHPRVADIIERFLKNNSDHYSREVFTERKRLLQDFAEAHGQKRVNDRDCLPLHLEEWVADHPSWKSDWTKAQAISVVLRVFNWAAKKRLITANPFRGVEKNAGERRRPLTDEEFQLILRHATVCKNRKQNNTSYPSGRRVAPSDRKARQRPSSAARFRQVLICLRYTGMRPGELRELQWSDVDIKAGELILRKHKTVKKTQKPRRVPIHPVILKLLIFLKKLNQPGEHVFLTHRKTPWHRVSLSQRLRRTRRAAGISEDAKLYGLRHGFATRAILGGVDIKTLAELLGHSTTRMSEHYLHLVGQREHLASAMMKANSSSRLPSDDLHPGS